MSHPNEGQDRMDYRETSDVTEVHASILREHAEPSADTTPIPTWLSLVSAAALCWAGLYIGMFHGGFDSTIYNEYQSNPSAFFSLPAKKDGKGKDASAEQSLFAMGESVYRTNCAACHQANGMGTPGAFPPLAGSEWVVGPEATDKRLAAIILKGMQGPVSAKGNTYNGAMPPWESLGNKRVAAVLTYIRQAFGNEGAEINEAQVAAAKKEFEGHSAPFTAEEIMQIPVDATLEGGSSSAAPQPVASSEAPSNTQETNAPAVASEEAAAPAAPVENAEPAGNFDLSESVSRGKSVYASTCMACHGPTGTGVPPAFPPLAGTDYVTGDARRLIAITLKGVTGPLKVNDKSYVGVMPAPELSFPILKDDGKMADVLNYVRNSFGNQADKPITPEMVSNVRKEFADRTQPWTEAELLSFPEPK